MLERFDARSIGRLLSDDATALTSTQILASTVLTSILMEASGMVEAACLAGGKYSSADLTLLQSPTMTNGGQTLAGLVADLGMWRVWDRRPTKDSPLPKRCELAFALLDQLRAGDRIFGFVETQAAGRIDHSRMTPDEVRDRNDSVTILKRYFGDRASDNPRNQS